VRRLQKAITFLKRNGIGVASFAEINKKGAYYLTDIEVNQSAPNGVRRT